MSSSIIKVCDLLKIIASEGTMAQKHAAAIITNTNNIISTGINSTFYNKAEHGSCHAEASAIEQMLKQMRLNLRRLLKGKKVTGGQSIYNQVAW